MTNLALAVKKHYQEFLGSPSSMHSVYARNSYKPRYDIVEFKGVPCHGATTIATLGLCNAPTHMFRQELLFLCYDRFLDTNLQGLIDVIADSIIASNHPLLHGQVVPPAGPLTKSTEMEALYVASLLYFNNPEHQYDLVSADGYSVLNSWLLPIYASEASWIARHNSDAFESLIVEQDPDLLDLTRSPIV